MSWHKEITVFMKEKRRLIIFIAIIACMFLIILQKDIRISYHKYMKQYCEEKARACPPLDDRKTEYYRQSNSHLKSLVRLDYYEKKSFELKHIKKSSPDARQLEHILIHLHIYNDHIIIFPLRDPEVDYFNVIVYAPHEYMSQYETVIHGFSIELSE